MSADLMPGGQRPIDRRRLLAAGTATAVGVWVAPSIIRLDRVAAATGSLGNGAYFLHNNPMPPTGDTASQAILPIDSWPPTATSLVNYDNDRDAFAGLLLKKGEGLIETDPTKAQQWASDGNMAISLIGTISVNLWTAMKDLKTDKAGSIAVGVYDCDSTASTCALVASSTFALDPWPSEWTRITVDLGAADHVVVAGRRMAVRVATLSDSDDDLWFAYDTTSFDSNLTIT